MFMIATYGDVRPNSSFLPDLPVDAIHLDLVDAPGQLTPVIERLPESMTVSLGLVDGSNIWINDYEESLDLIVEAKKLKEDSRLMVATSDSLRHLPENLEQPGAGDQFSARVKKCLACAREKLDEVVVLARLSTLETLPEVKDLLSENSVQNREKKNAPVFRQPKVRKRIESIRPE